MVRLINEKLAEAGASSITLADSSRSVRRLGLPFPGNVDVESIFGVDPPVIWEEGQPARQRASSTVSSTASSMRAQDDFLWRRPNDSWAVPEPTTSRRATFDQSDFLRYHRRPAWKCKHCDGVGWSEEDPCDGCGRYLPENFQVPRTRTVREGDWNCESCGNTNWEWRMQCNRCHSCRSTLAEAQASVATIVPPVEEIVKQRLRKRLSTHPAGVFKDNDWVCVSCGNINWDWRVRCHQCSAGKPVGATNTSRRPVA
jgi:hypothetical protein